MKKIFISFILLFLPLFLFAKSLPNVRNEQCVKEFDEYINGVIPQKNIRIINNSNSENFLVRVFSGKYYNWEYHWTELGNVNLDKKKDNQIIYCDLGRFIDCYSVTIDYAVDFSFSLSVKKDVLYITIDRVELLTPEEFDKMVTEKNNRIEEERRLATEEYESYLQEVYDKGKLLYEKEIVPLEKIVNEKYVPISIDDYSMAVDKDAGVYVRIELENLSDKAIKYIKFDLTPYNSDTKIVIDQIGNSRKTVLASRRLNPKENFTFTTSEPVWYDFDITYVHINAIEVTYSDNSIETVKNVNNVFKARERYIKTIPIVENDELKIIANYDFRENIFYIDLQSVRALAPTSSDSCYIHFDVKKHGNMDSYLQVNSKSGWVSVADYNRKYKYILNNPILESAFSGRLVEDIFQRESPNTKTVLYEFSENDIKNVNDFICIWYYSNNKMNYDFTKGDVVDINLCFVEIKRDGTLGYKTVTRPVTKTGFSLSTAIRLILEGPSMLLADEKNCVSLIPHGTKLLDATVSNGVAMLNFNDVFEFNPDGTEGYIAQLKQIVFTATQFDEVKSVQFLIEGEKVDCLGYDGIFIGKPLNRASFKN